MPVHLYLSPTLQAAQNHVVEAVQFQKTTNRLAPAYILLPTAAAVRDMQRTIGDAINVKLLDFYRLGRWILDCADSADSELSDVAIRRLIYQLLSDMHEQDELTTFSTVWDKPGFVQSLIEWLREMKTQGISPQDVTDYAANAGEKDRQLALLYERYQAFMHDRNFSDTEGLLWLAAEALESRPTLFSHVSPLYVIGFDQFTPIVQRILRALAVQLEQLNIYLLWDDEQRSEGSLALARPRTAHDTLIADMAPQIHRLNDIDRGTASTLTHLRCTLFEPVQTVPTDGAVRAIAAPSREAEVRRALRAIKRLLLTGVDIDQIALVTTNPGAYNPIIDAIAAEYDLPVALEHPLTNNPAVQTLLNILRLPPEFAWRTTFDVLRSPYIARAWLTPTQIDLLDRLTRERPVIAGKAQWHQALTPLQWTLADTEQDDLGPPPLAATLSDDELNALRAGLDAFFTHITPPQSGTYEDFVYWLQDRILGLESKADSLHMITCCQTQADYSERDLDALRCVVATLRSLLQAIELVPYADDVVTWASFYQHLVEALTSTTLQREVATPVLIVESLLSARSQTIEHLYILGLSEGELPRPTPPDVFYDPIERANHPLPLAKPTPAESASVWWQIVSNAQQTLTLLRPRIDEGGAPWLPSPYWTEVVNRLAGLQVEETRIDPELLPEEAASPAELMIALVRQGQALPDTLSQQQTNITHATRITRIRQSWDAPGIYEGVLQETTLLNQLEARYGSNSRWSVSRLNRYGTCPYLFFAEHVLKLEARPDPETGLDVRQRGSLLHGILEALYCDLTADQIMPDPDTKELILQRLDEVCERRFAAAPKRYGFRPNALWQYEQAELRRMLHALVVWECDDASEGGYRPYMQEARFGLGQGGPPALSLTDAEGIPYRLHGIIDRMDRNDVGRVRVIDYKSGSSAFSRADIENGAALQTALYAHAVETIFDGTPVVDESFYLHIPTRKASGKVGHKGSNKQELIEAAVTIAGYHVARVRHGYFPVTPYKTHTCTYCDFRALCRVNRRSKSKALQQEV
jgi:ATP-dependent helicase/nuclease subunit B